MYLKGLSGNAFTDGAMKEFEDDVQAIFSDERVAAMRKKIEFEVAEIVDDAFAYLVENAREHLARVATGWAEEFIARVLQGDEDAVSSLFGFGDGSRYQEYSAENKPWASLIHGKLFESGAAETRRKLVEANAEILRDERVADLEAVIDGLSRQIRKLEHDNGRLLEMAR